MRKGKRGKAGWRRGREGTGELLKLALSLSITSNGEVRDSEFAIIRALRRTIRRVLYANNAKSKTPLSSSTSFSSFPYPSLSFSAPPSLSFPLLIPLSLFFPSHPLFLLFPASSLSSLCLFHAFCVMYRHNGVVDIRPRCSSHVSKCVRANIIGRAKGSPSLLRNLYLTEDPAIGHDFALAYCPFRPLRAR